jgi:predicted N-acetyltransferase YhbS
VRVAIRLERSADRPAGLEVERAAFGATGDTDVAIVEAVRDEEGAYALVAEEGGRVVGHIQFSRAWIGDTPVLALGPIGVLPERQGRGIGSALVAAGLAEARGRGERAVILLGDPGYYGRLGFGPAIALGLRNPFASVTGSGFTIDEEDLQLVVLGEGPALAGEVRWHPAFGQGG